MVFMIDSVSNVQGRILMEMNYMLAYGSAEASLRLLWKFGILEILLPIQVNFSQDFTWLSLLGLIIKVCLSNFDFTGSISRTQWFQET